MAAGPIGLLDCAAAAAACPVDNPIWPKRLPAINFSLVLLACGLARLQQKRIIANSRRVFRSIT